MIGGDNEKMRIGVIATTTSTSAVNLSAMHKNTPNRPQAMKFMARATPITMSYLQYDGSKDDLDWRIDFKYLNFI